MKNLTLLLAFCLSVFTYGQNKQVELLGQSNFYFLDELSKDNSVKLILNSSEVFNDLKQSKLQQIGQTVDIDHLIDTKEIIKPYLFSQDQINSISNEFIRLYDSQKEVSDFINQIKKSNKYILWNDKSYQEFIANVVDLNLKGLNHTIEVYADGKKPFYPNIDSISFDKNSKYFKAAALFWAKHLQQENNYQDAAFFTPMLDYGLYLMYLNHRDEAIRYEPLDSLYNSKAIEYVKQVNFKDYPYNSIIVLGDGPNNYRDPLGALGKLNLKLAVEQYRAKKAPFIIVSGGHVHPNRTITCEAIEMKKELMDVYGINEQNIIIEPYARHTTTNLRNATRLMLDYGFDIDQKSMIVSYQDHIKSIYHENFNKRFLKELGYLPGVIEKQQDNWLLDFYPSLTMMHINPFEPLDP